MSAAVRIGAQCVDGIWPDHYSRGLSVALQVTDQQIKNAVYTLLGKLPQEEVRWFLTAEYGSLLGLPLPEPEVTDSDFGALQEAQR